MAQNNTRFKLGGELFEGGTTVNQAAAQTGQSVIPSTPLSAATVGAKPDAAKMVGTPAQKTAAVKSAPAAAPSPFKLDIPETQLLDWQDKIKKDPRQLGALEKDTIKQAEAMNPNLGSFAGRVPQLQIRAAMSGLKPGQVKLDEGKIQAFATERNIRGEDLTKDLTALVANPADPAAALKLIDTYKIEDPQVLVNMLTTAGATDAAQAILNPGQLTMDKVLAGTTPDKEFGMSEEGMTKMFGPDWRNKTWSELKTGLAQVSSKAVQTRDLMAVLNNPNIGQSQRSAARAALRELGVLGIRTAEEKINNVIAQIEDGDNISIGGKQMEVQDFLSDDRISQRITEAVDDPTGTVLKELEAEYGPELTKWIKDNEETLKKASSTIKSNIDTVNEVQKVNSKLNEFDIGAGQPVELNDKFMKLIDPTWGQPSTTKKDYSTNKVYAALKALPPTMAGEILSGLDKISAVSNDAQVKAIFDRIMVSKNPNAALTSMGLTTPEGIERIVTRNKELNEFDTRYMSSPAGQEQLVSTVFASLGGGTKGLVDFLKDPTNAEAVKLIGATVLDSNKDGKVTAADLTPAALSKRIYDELKKGNTITGNTLNDIIDRASSEIARAKAIAPEIKKEDDAIKGGEITKKLNTWFDGNGFKIYGTAPTITANTTPEEISKFISSQVPQMERELLRLAKSGLTYRKNEVTLDSIGGNAILNKYVEKLTKHYMDKVTALREAKNKEAEVKRKAEAAADAKSRRAEEKEPPSKPVKSSRREREITGEDIDLEIMT